MDDIIFLILNYEESIQQIPRVPPRPPLAPEKVRGLYDSDPRNHASFDSDPSRRRNADERDPMSTPGQNSSLVECGKKYAATFPTDCMGEIKDLQFLLLPDFNVVRIHIPP